MASLLLQAQAALGQAALQAASKKLSQQKQLLSIPPREKRGSPEAATQAISEHK